MATALAQLNTEQKAGWEAALKAIEHQAEHFEQRGACGAAEILRKAVRVGRGGGLECEHRRS